MQTRNANYQREVLSGTWRRGFQNCGFELYNPTKDTSESLNDISISFSKIEVVGTFTKILNCWRRNEIHSYQKICLLLKLAKEKIKTDGTRV